MIDDIKWFNPSTGGWVGLQLSKESIDFLWKIVNKASDLKNAKEGLAGNISQSFYIEDEDDWFFKNVLKDTIDFYMQHDQGKQHIKHINAFSSNYILKDKNNKKIEPITSTLELNTFWVNYQKKHEFNPIHNHGGVFSFVIWLKIPYDNEEQCKLSFLDNMDEDSKAPGEFQFQVFDMLGNPSSIPYKLGKEFEGRMLFFPSELRHLVNPFYETDEDRISISGNIALAINLDVERA